MILILHLDTYAATRLIWHAGILCMTSHQLDLGLAFFLAFFIGGGGIKLPVSFCFLGGELGEARRYEPGIHASMAFDDWRIWGSMHCFA